MNIKMSKSPQLIFYFFVLFAAFLLMSCMVLFVAYYVNNSSDIKKDTRSYSDGLVNVSAPNPTKKPIAPFINVCSFAIHSIMEYHIDLATPTNSYFGLTDKKASNARMCIILQGPNYKTSLEGFSGELVQINAYDAEETPIDALYSFVELRPTTSPTSLLFDNTIRFARYSYGSANQVILFSNGKIIYEIIWRSDKNIDSVINKLIEQMKNIE